MSETTTRAKVRHKTFTYNTRVDWAGDRSGTLASEGKPAFRVSSPPEFKGEDGVWTPEDLFVAAVDVCTLTTFVAFAARKQLPLVSYSSSAEGLLEFVDGGFQFTKVTLRPEIVVQTPEAVAAAGGILEDAHRACLVARSVRAEVVVEPTIEVAT
jgi:organic hydroperoxide reductase OsmC/OhrA